MQLKVINSNSSGNAYILESATDSLLIECGVHVNKIKKALNFKIDNVNAVVTHSHGDHACSIKDVLNAGISVYASAETLLATGIAGHHRVNQMVAGTNYSIGSFKVRPFNVNHDVPCFGFLIKHEESGLILFLTDTFYCNYHFPGLNNIIIECNHAVDLLQANTQKFLQDRIVKSHMNLETCKDLLRANNLSAVNNIVLIHLSDSNSDEERFQREVKEVTGKDVHIAKAGLCIPFNKTPF